ncbi:MAG TPA: hypothetical protein VH592_15920 [Gemmataceae bacterium]
MSSSKQFALRSAQMSASSVNGLIALAMILLMALPALGQKFVLPPHEQEAVNHAIDRGVAHLKKTQQKNGTWANPRGNWEEARRHGHVYAIGFTALPGLTLLECGVPASDPIIQQAAQFVRSKAAMLDQTYELSLAILFLDRLGDPEDKKIIQTFALRLIAGQSATGGWGYKCPLLGNQLQMELLTALRHMDPIADDVPGMPGQIAKKPVEMGPIARVPGAPPPEGIAAQPGSPSLLSGISRSPGESSSLEGSKGEDMKGEVKSPEGTVTKSPDREREDHGVSPLDNKRPQSPAPDLQALTGKKPQTTKPDGKDKGKTPAAKAEPHKSAKPYVIPGRIKILPVMQDPDGLNLQDPVNNPNAPFLTTTDNSNTQFAILALWRAQQYDVPMKRSLRLIVRRYQTSQNGDGSWGYHYGFGGSNAISLPNAMTCVGLIGLAVGHGLAQPKPAGQAAQDARIINGLISLSNSIGQPVEHRGRVPMMNLYFLWSLERVAVLYNLPTIGDKDWYRWGAQILVRNQMDEGFWANGKYIGSCPPLDTCLALLFLKRANLVKDLTAKLPFSAEDLNNSIMGKLTPSPEPTEKPKETKKKPPPVEPPKVEEPTPTVSKPAPAQEVTVSESENSGGKKKWIIISLIFFVVCAGGSAIVLFAARRRNVEESEEKDERQKKRTNKRKQSSTSPER